MGKIALDFPKFTFVTVDTAKSIWICFLREKMNEMCAIVPCGYNIMVIHVNTVKISFLIIVNHNIEWPVFKSIFG